MPGSARSVFGSPEERARAVSGPAPVLAACALALVLCACGPRDPAAEALEERGRWQVDLLGWVATDEGVRANLRLTGPVRASLDTLTVTLRLVGPGGELLEEVWTPLDVREARGGASFERFVLIPRDPRDVDGLAVYIESDPDPEQRRRIPELAGG